VRRLTVIADDSGAAMDAGQPDDPAAQWDRIVEAVARVHASVERVRDTTAREVGVDEAAIFETHLALLTDADILTDVRTRIDAGADAAAAWTSGLADVEQEWRSCPTAICASGQVTSAPWLSRYATSSSARRDGSRQETAS
jgi:phosphoenolpyruvate-protein kinase (PTS system EI component)